MIEYITQIGMFGLLWIISFIIFVGVLISFIKRNGLIKTFVKIIPILITFMLLNFFAKELIGKSEFDMVLTLVKDIWFLIGHLTIISILTIYDEGCYEFWKVLRNSSPPVRTSDNKSDFDKSKEFNTDLKEFQK